MCISMALWPTTNSTATPAAGAAQARRTRPTWRPGSTLSACAMPARSVAERGSAEGELRRPAHAWRVGGTALTHALLQFRAAAFEVFRAADAGGFGAAALRFLLAVDAEIAVGLDFRLQHLLHHFDHDRVVEEAEHRHVVRDQVFRVGEIGQCRDDAAAVFFAQTPAFVADHRDQV